MMWHLFQCWSICPKTRPKIRIFDAMLTENRVGWNGDMSRNTRNVTLQKQSRLTLPNLENRFKLKAGEEWIFETKLDKWFLKCYVKAWICFGNFEEKKWNFDVHCAAVKYDIIIKFESITKNLHVYKFLNTLKSFLFLLEITRKGITVKFSI